MKKYYKYENTDNREGLDMRSGGTAQKKNPIECKWVFTIKYKANRTNERYEVRLVVDLSCEK